MVKSITSPKLIDNDATTYDDSSTITIEFNYPIQIKSIYMIVQMGENTGGMTLYDSSGEKISYTSVRMSIQGSTTEINTSTLVQKIHIAKSNSSMKVLEIEVYSDLGIVSVTPANGRNDVSTNEKMTITFDDNVKSADVSISPNISFTKQIINNQVILTPVMPLEFDKEYTVTVNSASSQNSGSLSFEYAYSFKTRKDTSPIEVVYIKPPPDTIDVPINQEVEIGFNKMINGNTVDGVKVYKEGKEIQILKTISEKVIKISFPDFLENEKKYKIVIEGVEDLVGNKMSVAIESEFETIKDTDELLLLSYRPPSGVVPLNQTIELTFNKNVNPDNIFFSFTDDKGSDVPTTVNVVGTKVTIYPVLKNSTVYRINGLKASKIDGQLTDIPLDLEFKVMESTGDVVQDDITIDILNLINIIKANGLKIVQIAITTLLIFIASKYLWSKLKKFIKKS